MNLTEHWVIVFPVSESVVVLVHTADSVPVTGQSFVFVASVVVGLTMDVDVSVDAPLLSLVSESTDGGKHSTSKRAMKISR